MNASFGWVIFFFNDTASAEIYTLSLHDALPIWIFRRGQLLSAAAYSVGHGTNDAQKTMGDRKSTRLNSSHITISYAVFCLKKKKTHRHLCAPENVRADTDKDTYEPVLAIVAAII